MTRRFYNYLPADYHPPTFSWPCKGRLLYDNETLCVNPSDYEEIVVLRPDPERPGHWIVRLQMGGLRSVPLRFIHLRSPAMPALAFGLFEGL